VIAIWSAKPVWPDRGSRARRTGDQRHRAAAGDATAYWLERRWRLQQPIAARSPMYAPTWPIFAG
jgi:hypothetical protein